MHDMDELDIDASSYVYDVTFDFESSPFRRCGWHASWQWFVVQRSDGAAAVLQWQKSPGRLPQVTVREDPHHLICKTLHGSRWNWPEVIVGDGVHCPPSINPG